LSNRHRGTWVAGGVLLLIALSSLTVPALSPYDYYTPQLDLISRPPMLQGGHLLGTDPLGRDLLIRVLWGCRISLLIALLASGISVGLGVLWGAVAGYAGGTVDALMMRAVDVLYAVPFVPFVIVLTVLFGHELWLMFVAIGAIGTLGHFLFILALQRAPVSAIAPFTYMQLLWSTLAGWLVFGTFPDAWALAGIVTIAGSGVVLTWYERWRASLPPSEPAAVAVSASW